jgi:hypothetical protein
MAANPSPSSRGSGGAFLRSLILNAAVPVALYQLTKSYVSDSDVVALGAAALLPLAGTAYGLVRRARLDVIGVLVLLSIVVSAVALLIGGDARVLLIRESFLTGALGLACFVSLLLPRPLMFYFGRQYMCGDDPVAIARFDAQYQHPLGRAVHRRITIVWGVAYVGEFLIRVALVLTLPPVIVIGLSPLILGGITLGAITWTLAYVRSVQRRTHAAQDRELASDPVEDGGGAETVPCS